MRRSFDTSNQIPAIQRGSLPQERFSLSAQTGGSFRRPRRSRTAGQFAGIVSQAQRSKQEDESGFFAFGDDPNDGALQLAQQKSWYSQPLQTVDNMPHLAESLPSRWQAPLDKESQNASKHAMALAYPKSSPQQRHSSKRSSQLTSSTSQDANSSGALPSHTGNTRSTLPKLAKDLVNAPSPRPAPISGDDALRNLVTDATVASPSQKDPTASKRVSIETLKVKLLGVALPDIKQTLSLAASRGTQPINYPDNSSTCSDEAPEGNASDDESKLENKEGTNSVRLSFSDCPDATSSDTNSALRKFLFRHSELTTGESDAFRSRIKSKSKDSVVPKEFDTPEQAEHLIDTKIQHELECHSQVSNADSTEIGTDLKEAELLTESQVHEPESLLDGAPQETEPLVCFSPHERSLLKRYFELHDADCSNSLEMEELMFVLDDMNRTPKKGSEDERLLNRLFDECDDDNSGCLDFFEFLRLIEMYYQGVYSRIFQAKDSDKSGSISVFELDEVSQELQRSGFMVDKTQAETLFNKVDTDGSGCLDFVEFCHLMAEYRRLEFQHLDENAGFSQQQVQYLQDMFDGADEDNSRSLDIREVVKLFLKSSLGQNLCSSNPAQLEELVGLFALMDKDRSATLDFQEFLMLLRVWDKKCGRSEQSGIEEDAKLSQQLLINKGLSQRNMRKARSFLADNAEERLLAQQCELSLEEVQILRENFVFSDTDGSDHLCDDELPSLMKNCGCEPTTNIQKKCLTDTLAEFHKNGIELDFFGVVKLLVEYNNRCANVVINNNGDSKGLSTNQLVVIFYSVGQYLTWAKIKELLVQVGVDLQDLGDHISEYVFKKMLIESRINRLQEWRSTYGYKEAELQRFKDAFNKDVMSRLSDDAENVAKNLGFDTESEDGKMTLQDWKASLQRDQEVSWENFLLLLKHLDMCATKRRRQLEGEIANEMGLDANALREIRKLFQSCEYDEEKVPKNSIRSMLSSLNVVKTQEQRIVLRKALDDVADEGLDFVQFLRILQSLDSCTNR